MECKNKLEITKITWQKHNEENSNLGWHAKLSPTQYYFGGVI
jgi:hypothetical protein